MLVDISQLTLWQTTDPFRCTPSTPLSPAAKPTQTKQLKCAVHYLPLWLLSNFLHKGVLIFTTIVYSWRLQLESTSTSILRSTSGSTLLSSTFILVCISLLSPLVCISSPWPSLQVSKFKFNNRLYRLSGFKIDLFGGDHRCSRRSLWKFWPLWIKSQKILRPLNGTPTILNPMISLEPSNYSALL
jgi:hypothetical protein